MKKLGENLPKGVAHDWKTFITHADSMLEVANRIANYYDSIGKKMLMINFSNDKMSPKKAADELADRPFTNADVEGCISRLKNRPRLGTLEFLRSSSRMIFGLFRLNG